VGHIRKRPKKKEEQRKYIEQLQVKLEAEKASKAS
jgi:hypothetical protein